MKKFLLIVGASVGFILGSRSGRRPYELLETQVRKLAYRSDVQYTVDRTKWAVKGKVGDATTAIGDTAGEVAQGMDGLTSALAVSDDEPTEIFPRVGSPGRSMGQRPR